MKGYTLIEILVAISISSMLLIALVLIISTAFPEYRSIYLQSDSDETARIWLQRIARELREARPSDAGAYSIVEASSQKVIFYANVDSDAATERVRYELIGTNLIRGITKPSGDPLSYDTSQEVVSTVARSIYNGSTPMFTYYGGNYPADQSQLVLP